jgi:hypothetical protein
MGIGAGGLGFVLEGVVVAEFPGAAVGDDDEELSVNEKPLGNSAEPVKSAAPSTSRVRMKHFESVQPSS